MLERIYIMPEPRQVKPGVKVRFSTVQWLLTSQSGLLSSYVQESWALLSLSGRLEDLCRDLRRSVEHLGRGPLPLEPLEP